MVGDGREACIWGRGVWRRAKAATSVMCNHDGRARMGGVFTGMGGDLTLRGSSHRRGGKGYGANIVEYNTENK